MVKARAGSILLIGITALNVQRLMEGKPILFDADILGPELKGLKIAIHYGRTEEVICEELELKKKRLG